MFATNIAARELVNVHYLLLGALLFLVSYTALAFNRICQPYRAAQAIILSTYYMAQYFIAASAITV